MFGMCTGMECGKVIDKLAKLFKLTNNNDKPGSKGDFKCSIAECQLCDRH